MSGSQLLRRVRRFFAQRPLGLRSPRRSRRLAARRPLGDLFRPQPLLLETELLGRLRRGSRLSASLVLVLDECRQGFLGTGLLDELEEVVVAKARGVLEELLFGHVLELA